MFNIQSPVNGHLTPFREIGEEYTIDLAIFDLGAYDPRSVMAPDHVNPSEAVKAFQELRAKHLLIVHWGSFRLGFTPVHFPPIELQREAEKARIADRIAHLTHGQPLFYDKMANLETLLHFGGSLRHAHQFKQNGVDVSPECMRCFFNDIEIV